MTNLSSLKFWYGLLLMVVMVAFTACVDDNDDTEAPYLKLSPTTLTFTGEGTPAEGSQSYFEISTNRKWTATVESEKSWVTLSAYEGEGTAKIEVSVPAGISDNANIDIKISNSSGILMSKTVKVYAGSSTPEVLIFREEFGTPTKTYGAKGDSWPYVDQYDGWVRSGEGIANVTYEGTAASIRNASPTSDYSGASGTGKLFFANNASFIIKNIVLGEGQTNLKLTFGGAYFEYSSQDKTFNADLLHFYLSADGMSWSDAVAYTTTSVSDSWVMAAANFTLTKAVSNLYIKFAADKASVFSVDDITLSTGNGGQEITLEGGAEPEPGSGTPINNLAKLIDSGAKILTEDYEFNAIVSGDPKVCNASSGTLYIMTKGATTAGEGLTLYGGNDLHAAIQSKFTLGDEVKVSLKAATAQLTSYNGIPQVTGWAIDDIEVISSGNIVTPIEVTVDRLAEFAGMPVKVKDVTAADGGIWTNKTYKEGFTVNGTSLTIYVHKNATAIIGNPYKATTGAVSGIVSVYNGAQIAPRNIDDLSDFISNSPMITDINPDKLSFTAAGGSKTVEVSLVNAEGKSLSVSKLSGILNATVSGTTVTVVAEANTDSEAVNQTLTISLEGGNTKEIPITVEAASTGNEETITIDFTQEGSYPAGFPAQSADKKVDAEAFTIDGQTLMLEGSKNNGYYRGKSGEAYYLLIGKANAYIELPTVSGKKLLKVIVTSTKIRSEKVSVGIVDPDDKVVAGGEPQVWADKTNVLDFTYSLSDTKIDAKYRVKVTNENNAQFSKLKLIYE